MILDWLTDCAIASLVPIGQLAVLVTIGYMLRTDKPKGGAS